MPLPVVGYFKFEFAKNQAIVNPTQQQIYGFSKNVLTFAEVLDHIDHKCKTRFVEQSVGSAGKCEVVTTSPILISNGNILEETYYFPRNKSTIYGHTKLIDKAA